jgi:[acyl-carrier-protein] S-malonyltransferase
MPRTAFLFPGQGAQHLGMGGTLASTLPAAKKLFDEAARVLGYDLLSVCLTGPQERLNATEISQPAIFVASLAALEQLRANEPSTFNDVTATAGLSLGEYTALVFAGALSFQDALKVVQARGQAMQKAAEATPSGMTSVIGLDLPDVDALVESARGSAVLQIANILCPGNIVVSGDQAGLESLTKHAESKGYRLIPLAVSGAFHTDLMKPADLALSIALDQVEIRQPRIPVWSNVDAKPHTDPVEIRQLLVKQILSPVKWEESMRGIIAEGVETFYEIGPKNVLAGLMKRIQRRSDFRNVLA